MDKNLRSEQVTKLQKLIIKDVKHDLEHKEDPTFRGLNTKYKKIRYWGTPRSRRLRVWWCCRVQCITQFKHVEGPVEVEDETKNFTLYGWILVVNSDGNLNTFRKLGSFLADNGYTFLHTPTSVRYLGI